MTNDMKTPPIESIIASGEGQAVEFKGGFSPDIGKTICAFANTNHGTILIGVADDGQIKGVADAVEEKIANLAHACKPAVYPRIRREICRGKAVLIVDVARSRETLHSFGNIAYRRVGSTDRPISPDEVVRMAVYAKGAGFDRQLAESPRSSISDDVVRDFARRAASVGRLQIDSQLTVDDILAKLDLVRPEGITHAAVLLFGQDPQKELLQAEVRCARFKGTEPITFTDMKVLHGTLVNQVEKIEQFVKAHVELKAEISGFKRVETWAFPLVAVREAIVNAICHRDYTSAANVQLSIFDDRLEIWNPGDLPPELSVDALRRPHRSIPRNALIAQVLYYSQYIERWGTGTQRMIRVAATHGLTVVEFRQEQGGFTVAFRKAARSDALNERQNTALDYLATHETINRRTYMNLCACSSRTASRDLDELCVRHLLERQGSGKSISYRALR